jgi:hypothetical protein
MNIIKNRPLPKAHAGARRIPNDPADLMEPGDCVVFDNIEGAHALTSRLRFRGNGAALRTMRALGQWVVWRTE